MTRELWFRHGVQYCGESLLGVPVGYPTARDLLLLQHPDSIV